MLDTNAMMRVIVTAVIGMESTTIGKSMFENAECVILLGRTRTSKGK